MDETKGRALFSIPSGVILLLVVAAIFLIFFFIRESQGAYRNRENEFWKEVKEKERKAKEKADQLNERDLAAAKKRAAAEEKKHAHKDQNGDF